jgi:hypothetical protein
MPDSAAKPSREPCRLLVEADLARFKADLAPLEIGEVRVGECISNGEWHDITPAAIALAEAHHLHVGIDIERPERLALKQAKRPYLSEPLIAVNFVFSLAPSPFTMRPRSFGNNRQNF